jgi:hypothetical protein
MIARSSKVDPLLHSGPTPQPSCGVTSPKDCQADCINAVKPRLCCEENGLALISSKDSTSRLHRSGRSALSRQGLLQSSKGGAIERLASRAAPGRRHRLAGPVKFRLADDDKTLSGVREAGIHERGLASESKPNGHREWTICNPLKPLLPLGA